MDKFILGNNYFVSNDIFYIKICVSDRAQNEKHLSIVNLEITLYKGKKAKREYENSFTIINLTRKLSR